MFFLTRSSSTRTALLKEVTAYSYTCAHPHNRTFSKHQDRKGSADSTGSGHPRRSRHRPGQGVELPHRTEARAGGSRNPNREAHRKGADLIGPLPLAILFLSGRSSVAEYRRAGHAAGGAGVEGQGMAAVLHRLHLIRGQSPHLRHHIFLNFMASSSKSVVGLSAHP